MLNRTLQLLFLGSPILGVAVVQGLCIRYDWFHGLKRPLDLGKSVSGKRIFGDHKTWRGMIINLVFCTLGTLIQGWMQESGHLASWLPLVDYSQYGSLLGILMGLGMTAGELPNSFLKRRLGISPGKGTKGPVGILFFLFDQVDVSLGIWVFIFLLIRPTLGLVLYSLLLTLVLHVSVSAIGYILGMRKTVV